MVRDDAGHEPGERGADLTSVEGISRSFAGKPALRDLSLALKPGKITVILGPSGCGKTTFLRILAGLDEPDEGRVIVAGRVVNDPRSLVPPEARRIGMVFQDSMLWPHLNVRKNIAFPVGSGGAADGRVAAAAEAAEVTPFLERYPAKLSGGERRRVAIARAVVGKPSLLLLDEPLSGLDANLRVRMLGTIASIQRRLGVTAVYVTHDQEEALGIADRIAVLRKGRLLQEGTPENVYQRPRTAFVAGFVGLSSFLRGTVATGEIRTEFGSFPGSGADGADVLLAVRPESVRIGEEGAPVRVFRCSYHGDRWLLELGTAERRLLAWSAVRRETDSEVRIRLDPAPVPVAPDEEDA